MIVHPFTESLFIKVAGIAGALLAAIIFGGLLVCYGNVSVLEACTQSILYISLLSLAGFLYGYVYGFLPTFYARLVVALAAQAIVLAIISGSFFLFGLQSLPPEFVLNIPLYLMFGLLCWLSLSLWYYGFQSETSTNKAPEETLPLENKLEIIDRISVKEGTRIHIIRPEELLHIQACGDYVMLITPQGEFLKGQTMKYFESHLPDTFVRIHRSCIVNTDQVVRIELSGKDKYNVWLKNGIKLHAGTSGYKLLKERLKL